MALAPLLHVVRPTPFVDLLQAARAWPVTAQQAARRNAMIALTECTRRRAEREDVERFLAERAAGASPSAPSQERAAVSLQA